MKFKYSVVSGSPLEELFSLGNLYVSNFLLPNESPECQPCELALAFDPISKLAQLTKQPPASEMWGSMYWYRSATNPSMQKALKDLAEATSNCIPLSGNPTDIYLDIASNDCTLLSFVDQNDFLRVGIDPSDYPEAEQNADIVIRDYFNEKSYRSKLDKRASRISCAAMFYDLEKPIDFLLDVCDVLEDNGVFVLQLSYTPLMLMETEFGNLCHEHLCYYNLTSLKYLFDRAGLEIKDIEINSVNGGSIRVFLQKDIAANNFKTDSDRQCAKIRIESLLQWEENNGFNDKKVYLTFFKKINRLKRKTVDFIDSVRREGKTVAAYGASTKGNTLLQYFGLDHTKIDFIAEKQSSKFGRKTIGTNIPIVSEEEFRERKPDYCLILPWFFKDVFIEREADYLKGGGRFIVPCPDFEII